jgi:hypothetical protein
MMNLAVARGAMRRNVRVVQAFAVMGLGTLVVWIMLRSSDSDRDGIDHDAADARASPPRREAGHDRERGRHRTAAVANIELPAPTARSTAFLSRAVSASRGDDHAMPLELIKVADGSGFVWVRKLDQAFKPLMWECIDLAKARKPGLHGLLSFRVTTTPTANDRVVVESMKSLDNNQIEDPELFECLRESALSLEEMNAPHDFDLIVPIAADASGLL